MFRFIWNNNLQCYCAEHNSTIRADKMGNIFGGGSTQVQQPNPPPQPSTAEAMTTWANTLPQVYQTQLQYEPQLMASQLALQIPYAQQMLELQQQLQTEYAPQMAQGMYDISQQLYPTTVGLQEQLAQQASEGMTSQVPAWMQEQYRSNMAANLGTNAGSPIGADYMSRGLLEQQQNWQQYYNNLGLSVTGRQPLTQPQQVNTPQYQGTGWTSGYTPQNTMNFMGQGYGNYAGLYGSMYGANANAMASQNQMYGAMVGGIGQGLGAYMNPYSSVIFKENIKDNKTDTLGILKDLHIVTYTYKPEIESSGKNRIGILTEEIPALLKSDDGLSLDVMNIIGTLLDANKKLIDRVEKLEVANGTI